jgi:hypothetical protein
MEALSLIKKYRSKYITPRFIMKYNDELKSEGTFEVNEGLYDKML